MRLGKCLILMLAESKSSELGPLLFGMFINVLHEPILMQVPGAGPVDGNLNALLDIIRMTLP